MNKSKLVIALSLIFMSLSFYSCDDEPVDPALLNIPPTTDCGAPLFFEASDFIGGNSVMLSWEAAPSTSSWQIQYGTAGFVVGSGLQITATDTEVTIPGLVSTNNYEFYIRALCGAESFSGWVGPIAVGESIGSCLQPTGVTAVRSAGNTEITVSWGAVAGVASYDIQYGPAGFALGSGTTTNSTTNSKTITGVAVTAYHFYVRSNCSGTDHSSWVGPINVDAAGAIPDGDYWPTSIGNEWVYEIDGVEQDPVSMISTNVIGGNTYYTFAPTGLSMTTQRIRKQDGNYYLKTENISLPANPPLPASTTTGNEIIILKDNIPVGGTWSDSYSQTTTYEGLGDYVVNIARSCVIAEKGISLTVNGVAYEDVIHMTLTQEITGATPGISITNYWFAKNVGPIKIITGTETQELLTYDLN